MGRWKNGLWMVSIICITASLAACTSGNGDAKAPNREVVEKPDKTITVIEAPEPKHNQIEIGEIATINGVRALDFLSDTSVIISRANTAVEPLIVEGMKFSPNNLYVYDTAARTETALHPGRENQNAALMSPDRKHLFYKTNRQDIAHGFMLNMETKEVIKTGDASININTGEWLDNDHVMFLTNEGRIMSCEVSGNCDMLLDGSGLQLLSAVKGKGGIYYVQGEKLFFADDDSGKTKIIEDKVSRVAPSPDGSQLAIVRQEGTIATLAITGLNGKTVLEIDSAEQIFSPSWSPDGPKLVYNSINEDGGKSGIVVADSLTGEKTAIAIDMKYATDPQRWSPSGNKFITSTLTPDELIAYIVTIQ